MSSRSSKPRRGVRHAIRGLAMAACVVSMSVAAHATSVAEGGGDFSSDPTDPTSIGDLTLGNNFLTGKTIPRGIFLPEYHSYSSVDNDYVTFTVQTGQILSNIVVDGASVIQDGDRMFFGIAQGTTVDVDPSFSSATGLLGWTLVGKSDVGTDVLPALGASAPADFPPIGGATGFTGSLGAGDYTLWLLDGDSPAKYKLDLVTAPAVPEPATWASMLLGFAAVGVSLRRRGAKRLFAAT